MTEAQIQGKNDLFQLFQDRKESTHEILSIDEWHKSKIDKNEFIVEDVSTKY